MVIKGKSFKPPARGVPAVKAQTRAWARTQGRSMPGSRALLGGQHQAVLGSWIHCSSVLFSWCCWLSHPISDPLGGCVWEVGSCHG